jgi:hypothetical protein
MTPTPESPKATDVKRFRHYYNTWCGSECEAFSHEDPDGDWVRHEDYLSAQRAAEEARGERDALRREFADMEIRIARTERRANEALADLAQARGEWVACEAKLPDTGTEVLAVFPCIKADTVFIVLHDGMTWYDRDGNTFAMHPTHWRPLPPPPTAQNGGAV